jgi:hypothetical protein
MDCILADRLYVPEEYVTPEHLNEFVYLIENQDGAYDYGPFETVTGSIRTFGKANIGGQVYYAFSRGNLEKLGRLFGDLPWTDKTCAKPMTSDLQFKGALHTWESKQIGQQEAVLTWLRHKGGIIKAPPRFGKCCSGDTIIHTPTFGSIPIKDLFTADHVDGSSVPKCIELATKDGISTTSFIYKKIVDKTIRVTTKSGFSIEATPNHPLYIRGEGGFDWKVIEEIKVGDIVALKANTSVFSNRKSSHALLFAKYIKTNRKYAEKLVLRMMRYDETTQRSFLNEFIIGNEIESNNKQILMLFQIMILNCGYRSKIEE